MKKIIVLLLVLAVLLTACQPAAEKPMDKDEKTGEQPEKKEIIVDKSQIKFKIDDETKEKIEIQQKEDGVEIEGVEPTMEALATSKGPEWCKAGEQWKFSTAHEGIDASAEWEIQGIVESGEYAGLCHVVSTAQSPLGETKMDYYFAEDGESGYFEMKMPDGKVIKQEWTG
ncbi:hypothetical protein GF343_05110 [Candidatus Woesearchaeota archaeon]|nr:hypothetical protein [Candidatus Woesearchaeota archaeon]